MKNIVFLILVVSLYGCTTESESGEPIKAGATVEQKQMGTYTIRVVESKESTFGYVIFKDNQLLIEQLQIPGVDTDQGFADASSAMKVADFVVQKMQHDVLPPTVFSSELDSLGVLK